jgi:hypothetical protein
MISHAMMAEIVMARDYPRQTLSFTANRPTPCTHSFWLKHVGPPGETGRADAAGSGDRFRCIQLLFSLMILLLLLRVNGRAVTRPA